MYCISCNKEIDRNDRDYEQCNTCFSTFCINCSHEGTTTCDCCQDVVCHNCSKECETCGITLCEQCSIYDLNDLCYYCNECKER